MPIRRASEEAEAEAPTPKAEELPQTLPDLEESMALEFGDAGEIPAPAPEALEPEPPAQLETSGGFELMEEAEPPAYEVAPAGEAPLDEEPSFAEEPIELGAGSAPEIVLELDQPEDVAPIEEVEEVVAEVVVAGEEMEVIELEVESEPEMAAEGSDPLVGVLGEDIDSLIDSIIDDVGSSAKGEQPIENEPPTHIPLFSDLTTPEFIDVALLLVRRVLKVGELAVREGEPGDSMFIISTGEVRATIERDGRQVPVATLRDGDFFGEMAVLSGEPRTATVTAVKNTEVLELSRENLREICSRHPHVEAKIRLFYDERMASDRGR